MSYQVHVNIASPYFPLQPPFECLVKVIPKMSNVLEYAEKTKEGWKPLFEEYDKRLEENKALV